MKCIELYYYLLVAYNDPINAYPNINQYPYKTNAPIKTYPYKPIPHNSMTP